MKATRGCILALTMLAACSDQVTSPGGKRPDRALAAIAPTSNTACNKFWANGVSGNWTDPTKWNPAGVPTNASSVCINAAGAYTVTLPGGGTSADTTIADVLALDVGGAGASPTLVTTSGYAAINVAEGIIVRTNAILRINNSQSGVINAAETFTNSGSLEAVAPCGGGCAKDHVINANVINNGTILINGGNIKLDKTDGEYENTGTVNILGGTMLIPSTAGNALFRQDAGVITGASNFNVFTIRSGTFQMNGGKVRTRNGATNLKPIVVVDGANLVLSATATDSATIGVLGSSTTSTNLTGNVADLTVLWLAGPADLNPGTITFLDAAPVNNGRIRLGTIDGGQGDLTLGGTGRLTNADSIHADVSGSTDTYEFALELTNNGSMYFLQSVFFTKPGGTYYNAGLIAGSGTVNVTGNTLVSTVTGTVSPIGTSGTPRFRVDGGRLIGVGTSGQITLVNGGTLEPGLSPGILNATNLIMNPGTSLAIELGGTQPGTGHDQLNMAITQSFSAGGSVDLTEVNGFLSGICGQVFEVLSWNSTNSGPATFTGLTPAATRALRVFTHTATLPRKTILYGFDPTQKISVAPNPVAIAEGGPGVQYAVCLDGAPALTGGQTVTVTPTPDAQVTVSPPSVTFTSTNWRAPQFFTVTAVDDNVVEGNHAGSATHASSSGVAAYNGVAIASLTTNITDNDAPPQAATTTSVGSSLNPSTFGQSVTFTATVTSGAGTPGGTVQFNIDGNDVGSPVPLDGNGQATMVTSTLGVGNHPVQATYSGSTSFAGSNGALTGGQTVTQIPTSTAVSSNNNPSNVGQSVTFTATVSSSGGVPTGSVQFRINDINSGGPVALVSGQATLSTSSLSAGTHTVDATYAGSTNFAGSNGSLSGGQVVSLNATTTSVGSSQNPSTFGQSVTFTATVSSGAGTPSGSVQFSIDGSPAGGPVALVGGQATHVTSALTTGNHAISVAYAGTATYAGSNGALGGGQTVNQASTSTGVSSSANPSTSGQQVTFTATVTSGAGTPTGTVQFNIDGSSAGAAVPLDANGQATLSTSSLGVGNHPVEASFSGSTNYASSSGMLGGGQTVNAPPPGSSTTTVQSSLNPSSVGQSVTLTATVSSGTGTPTGTVQFSIDGSNVGGLVALVGGQATFATSTLGAGTHPVTATYSGSASISGSSGSLPGGQVVHLNATTTSVAASQNPSTFGQSVTFTATVSSGAGTPSGSVQFSIDGTPVGGSVALVGGQATLATSTLSAGNHAISVTYGGSSVHAGSNGSLGGGQQVDRAATSTVVTSSLNPSTAGQAVTFSATVSSGAGTPTGSVQFSIDGSPVGSPVSLAGGQATLVTSSLTAGNHSVSAAYSGSANYQPSNGTLSGGQTVNPPSTGTGIGQAGISIENVLITDAFKSGSNQNTARGSFMIRNGSSGPATIVTLGTTTLTFRSTRPGGAKTNHTATCTFAPRHPTGDNLAPLQVTQYDFDCTGITPSLLSSATELTAIVTVVNVWNQLGLVRVRTWSATSPAFKLP